MEDEFNYDDEEDGDSEPLMLSIAEDGKATLRKSSDYVEVLETDMKLIQGFLEENKNLFNEYLSKQQLKEGVK